jgi:hypothetical protein
VVPPQTVSSSTERVKICPGRCIRVARSANSLAVRSIRSPPAANLVAARVERDVAGGKDRRSLPSFRRPTGKGPLPRARVR